MYQLWRGTPRWILIFLINRWFLSSLRVPSAHRAMDQPALLIPSLPVGLQCLFPLLPQPPLPETRATGGPEWFPTRIHGMQGMYRTPFHFPQCRRDQQEHGPLSKHRVLAPDWAETHLQPPAHALRVHTCTDFCGKKFISKRILVSSSKPYESHCGFS